MPYFLLLCSQECCFTQYRNKEARLHLPSQPRRTRARPCVALHKYHTKVPLRWQPSSTCPSTQDNVRNTSSGYQPDCILGDQERVGGHEPLRQEGRGAGDSEML